MRTIRVTGEGKSSAAPDMATIHTGVVTQAPSAAEALAANNERMRALFDKLKELGIAEKDTQTSNLNVQPVYSQSQDPKHRETPRIVAYQVSNQVRVKVRKLDGLGQALDELVTSGSNQLNGISFELADPSEALDKARTEAVKDAKKRAELYAQAAGVRVGEIQEISEPQAAPPRPLFMGRAAAMEAASAVPVATGELDFHAQVNIVFTLDSD